MNDIQKLQELEEVLLTSAIRQNPMEIAGLLADEFREFGSSGRAFSKAEIINLLQEESAVKFSLEGFEIFPIARQAYLATYRVVKEAAGSPPSASLRSSVWIFRDERWQMLFHQGTKIP